MSQIVRVRRTRMVERGYLERALEDLGYGWQEGGRLGLLGPRVDIKARGNLGFREAGGAYEMVCTGAMARRQAEVLRALTQRYAYHAAREKLEAQGFDLVDEEEAEDGRIHMVLRRMA